MKRTNYEAPHHLMLFSLSLRSKHSPQHPVSQILSLFVLPLEHETKFHDLMKEGKIIVIKTLYLGIYIEDGMIHVQNFLILNVSKHCL
jgi:hypothetical protein